MMNDDDFGRSSAGNCCDSLIFDEEEGFLQDPDLQQADAAGGSSSSSSLSLLSQAAELAAAAVVVSVEPAAAVVLAPTCAPAGFTHRLVEGRDKLRLACYTEETLPQADKKMRSRTAVLHFAAVPEEERGFFARDCVRDILDRRTVPGRYGFTPKFTTHFEAPDGSLWLVIASKDPIFFEKWLAVMRGLGGALHIRVLHYTSSERGASQPGLSGVADIFRDMTNTEELIVNRIIYDPCLQVLLGVVMVVRVLHPLTCMWSQETTGNSSVYVWKPPQQQLPSSKRPRKSSSPSSSKKKSKVPRKTQEVEPVAVAVVEQQLQPPRLLAPPARASPCDALVQASKKFLADQALSTEAAWIYYNVLRQYLEGLPGSSGSIGLFLLSGRTLDMFAQVR